MKISKKGNIKLEKGDFRVDNYVFHEEKDFIKVCDINMLVSWRINNLFIGSGALLVEALKMARNNDEGAISFLKNYVCAIHLVLSTVPDIQQSDGIDYLAELCDASVKCIKRHPEVYGMENNPSDEKNEKDLDHVKNMEAVKEEIEKVVD